MPRACVIVLDAVGAGELPDAAEYGDRLVFLHAVRQGPANRSYGLQVAALAGVPATVVATARTYLAELERAPQPAPSSPG